MQQRPADAAAVTVAKVYREAVHRLGIELIEKSVQTEKFEKLSGVA
jgi:hypothetical protein